MEVKKLVAYFSATGNTKGVSLKLGQMMKADTYEIKPKKKYTEADLNWTNKKSRSSIEMGDPKSRVELSDKSANISNYDTIYLGFPIWWGVAPHIINTFLESYDFKGKTIVIFATSGGSGIGKCAENLKDSANGATIKIGGLVNSDLVLKKIMEIQ